MTITLFNKYYDSYKHVFDLETMLRKTGKSHAQAYADAQDVTDKYF